MEVTLETALDVTLKVTLERGHKLEITYSQVTHFKVTHSRSRWVTSQGHDLWRSRKFIQGHEVKVTGWRSLLDDL